MCSKHASSYQLREVSVSSPVRGGISIVSGRAIQDGQVGQYLLGHDHLQLTLRSYLINKKRFYVSM